mmetsp:Transcript_83597/g.249399  ORF Transcript_83597/g.249399 Transcript_83597/m.249399 type:complete len:212 (+) Transcript_83597:712-1347(+)
MAKAGWLLSGPSERSGGSSRWFRSLGLRGLTSLRREPRTCCSGAALRGSARSCTSWICSPPASPRRGRSGARCGAATWPASSWWCSPLLPLSASSCRSSSGRSATSAGAVSRIGTPLPCSRRISASSVMSSGRAAALRGRRGSGCASATRWSPGQVPWLGACWTSSRTCPACPLPRPTLRGRPIRRSDGKRPSGTSDRTSGDPKPRQAEQR